MRCAITIATSVLVSLSTGCLSTSHVIPKRDLQALAQSEPQTRSQRVRVIQMFSSQEAPPPAPAVNSSTEVSVVVVSPGPRASSKPASLGQAAAKSAKDNAKAWVIIAAAAAVGMAVTEGARYDGWVELHPMHPVHLYGWDGGYTWMPLAHITPETAAWARKAVIRETEGPWRRLERAPLNRRGWTYSMLMGSAEIPLRQQQDAHAFASHIQFGRFFNQEVGLLFDIGLAWTEDQLGNTLYDSRSSLEMQLLPLSAGKIHGGVFGQLGLGYRLDDTGADTDRQGYFFGGGGMLQLELTTRLAITARAGMAMTYGTQTVDFTAGLSIY